MKWLFITNSLKISMTKMIKKHLKFGECYNVQWLKHSLNWFRWKTLARVFKKLMKIHH